MGTYKQQLFILIILIILVLSVIIVMFVDKFGCKTTYSFTDNGHIIECDHFNKYGYSNVLVGCNDGVTYYNPVNVKEHTICKK